MNRTELHGLLETAISNGLVQGARIVGTTIFLRLLDEWVDMNEVLAEHFLQAVLSIDEQTRWPVVR